MRRRIGLCLIVLAAVGCEPEDPSSQQVTLEVREVARFGGVEGAGDLDWVAGLAVSDDAVFVLDSRAARVVVFSPDGAYLRDIGRRGGGPGEFQRPEAIGRIGDTLWVADPPGGRLELLTESGQTHESIRWIVPADTLGTPAAPFMPMMDGSILAVPQSMPVSSIARGAIVHRNYYRTTPDGAEASQLYRERLVPTDFVTAEIPNGMMVGLHPHRQSPLVDPLPDGSGLAVVERSVATDEETAVFRFLIVRTDGTHAVDIEVPYEPTPADGWRERHIESIEADMLASSGTIDRTFIERVQEAISDLSYYPPVTQLVAGHGGVVWLRREDSPGDSVRWEKYDVTGDRLGSAVLPSGARMIAASADEVWAVIPDEYDVPVIYRWQIVQPGTPQRGGTAVR